MYAASSRVQHLTTSHAASLKHTLSYIKGTMDYRRVLGRHLQRQSVHGTVSLFPSPQCLH